MPQKRKRRGEELRELRCRQCIGQHERWEEENQASTSNGEAGGHETSEGSSTRTGELGAKGISPIEPSKPELSPKPSPVALQRRTSPYLENGCTEFAEREFNWVSFTRRTQVPVFERNG
ncbi:hypothetical protein EDC04DRAFT_2614355 [Pisolithus marmoratus]|nr:hypothetical protein EDC04DRAFT_2614355 [Pisolithus marmoratus]